MTKTAKNVGVFCETTGRTFATIRDAARFAGVNEWTMSVKMSVKGQFVDSLGRVYKRLRPMETKNTYTTRSDKMEKPRHPKKNKKAPEAQDSLFSGAIIVDDKPKKTQKEEVADIVKRALEDKVVALLKEHGIYESVTELLAAAGHPELKEKK